MTKASKKKKREREGQRHGARLIAPISWSITEEQAPRDYAYGSRYSWEQLVDHLRPSLKGVNEVIAQPEKRHDQ